MTQKPLFPCNHTRVETRRSCLYGVRGRTAHLLHLLVYHLLLLWNFQQLHNIKSPSNTLLVKSKALESDLNRPNFYSYQNNYCDATRAFVCCSTIAENWMISDHSAKQSWLFSHQAWISVSEVNDRLRSQKASLKRKRSHAFIQIVEKNRTETKAPGTATGVNYSFIPLHTLPTTNI